MLQKHKIVVTGAAGGAGVATATGYSNEVIYGMITGVHIEYTDSPPATADIVVKESVASPSLPIITVSNNNTDGWYHPVSQASDVDGAVMAGQGVPIIIADIISVTIAQADNDDGAIVTLYVER